MHLRLGPFLIILPSEGSGRSEERFLRTGTQFNAILTDVFIIQAAGRFGHDFERICTIPVLITMLANSTRLEDWALTSQRYCMSDDGVILGGVRL